MTNAASVRLASPGTPAAISTVVPLAVHVETTRDGNARRAANEVSITIPASGCGGQVRLFANCPVKRIISGGQTGVDRGALEAALSIGVAHGGWCPRGRRAEDGRVPLRYDMSETDSSRYDIRTEKNILDSDATLIIHQGPLTAGTALTRRLAHIHGKPLRLIDLALPIDWNASRRWLLAAQVRVLNVAGPRESSCPGIAERAQAVLATLLRDDAASTAPNSEERAKSEN